MLVFSAADFEDFLEPRPDLPDSLETELKDVVTLLAQNRCLLFPRWQKHFICVLLCVITSIKQPVAQHTLRSTPLVRYLASGVALAVIVLRFETAGGGFIEPSPRVPPNNSYQVAFKRSR
jgi:hypothetical protein